MRGFVDFLKGKVTPKDWVAVAAFIGITAALVAVFYVLVYKTQLEEIVTLNENNEKVQKDLTKAIEIDRNIETYITETDEIRSLVEQFEDRLPSKREIVSLLGDFEDMADAANVKIEASPLKRTLDASKETIPYKIKARGGFHQVANFINSLERFRRYLKITELKMEPNVDGVATFEFTLNTYRFLQSTETDGQK